MGECLPPNVSRSLQPNNWITSDIEAMGNTLGLQPGSEQPGGYRSSPSLTEGKPPVTTVDGFSETVATVNPQTVFANVANSRLPAAIYIKLIK